MNFSRNSKRKLLEKYIVFFLFSWKFMSENSGTLAISSGLEDKYKTERISESIFTRNSKS